MVWLVEHVSVTVLVVTVLASMASENVSVNAALRSTPVVPEVAIVVELCTNVDTVGVLEAVVNVNVTAEAMATPPALLIPVVAVTTQVAPSAMALAGVMVAPLLPTVATVTVWLVESQLSVSVDDVRVDVSIAVENVIENAEAIGTSVLPVVLIAVPLVVVKEATIGAADGDGAGLLTEFPH